MFSLIFQTLHLTVKVLHFSKHSIFFCYIIKVSRKDTVMENEKCLYEIIANNIRKERKKLHMSQGQLAELAGLSIDTVKSIENGRRAMSLDTYLKLVQVLKTTPLALIGRKNSEEYIERFTCMIEKRNKNEIEFVLHMVEQILRGHDYYLCK